VGLERHLHGRTARGRHRGADAPGESRCGRGHHQADPDGNARDEARTARTKHYGWGFIDAYAAVLATPFGRWHDPGHVRNGSFGNLPIPGAKVELLGTEYFWITDANGYYQGEVPPETYTARASRLRFAAQEAPVQVIGAQVVVRDFALTDIAGPEITGVTQIGGTPDTAAPTRSRPASATSARWPLRGSTIASWRAHGSGCP